MKRQKVSIVIPVYNVEKYLQYCLDSISNQSFSDFEAICVDDCSSDASLSILNSHRQKDPRFIVVHNEKNEGAAETRNRGMFLARGEYLLFIDADDWILPDLLRRQLNVMESNDVDFVWGTTGDLRKAVENFLTAIQ